MQAKDKVQASTPRMGDLREQVTSRIVAMLAQGLPACRERWTVAAQHGIPCNGKTGERYHGVNVLLLWAAAMERGYTFNVWMTYRQAECLGAQVRRGEKGVMGVFFQAPEGSDRGIVETGSAGSAEERDGDPQEEGTHGRQLVCRAFWLFNVAQIDGLPDAVAAMALTRSDARFTPIDAADRLIDASGALIRHRGNVAFYSPTRDEIVLPPPACFTRPETYYATALHELVHFTGHPSRLHRDFGRRFGDAAYAFEELVAELGSAFLMADIGLVDATIEGHADYLQAWLRILRSDKTAIFTAARQAEQASAFLMACQC